MDFSTSHAANKGSSSFEAVFSLVSIANYPLAKNIQSNTLWPTKKVVSIKLESGYLDSRSIEMDTNVNFSHKWLGIRHGWSNKGKKQREHIWTSKPKLLNTKSRPARTTHEWRQMQKDKKIKKSQLIAKIVRKTHFHRVMVDTND